MSEGSHFVFGSMGGVWRAFAWEAEKFPVIGTRLLCFVFRFPVRAEVSFFNGLQGENMECLY